MHREKNEFNASGDTTISGTQQTAIGRKIGGLPPDHP
jgi:hypothetical protein